MRFKVDRKQEELANILRNLHNILQQKKHEEKERGLGPGMEGSDKPESLIPYSYTMVPCHQLTHMVHDGCGYTVIIT